MESTKIAVSVLAVALFASACSGSEQKSELTAEAYATRLLEIMNPSVPEEDFPVGGSNVRIAGIFAVVEDGLADMGALQPPPELQAIHAELLVRFDAVQEAVASYLQHHGVVGERIEMEHLVGDPEIGPLISEARDSCRMLRTVLDKLGVDFPIEQCLV